MGAMEEQIEQHVFRFVEKELFNYRINKKLVENWEAERQNIAEESKTTLSDDNERYPENKVSNPTLAKTMRIESLAMKADRARWYVRAIDDVMDMLDPENKKLVRLKYFQGLLTNAGVARELNISQREFYRRRKELVEKFGIRMGLL